MAGRAGVLGRAPWHLTVARRAAARAAVAHEQESARAPAPQAPAPRFFAHFLPKFENQGDTRLLGPLVDEQPSAFLCVAKKHSGSLVMCPPFFSKNDAGNKFSRMGALVLRSHFEAVWQSSPADTRAGETAFAAWWADSEAQGLCYSFELVVPRVLGEHGATPRGAYAVLTAVSSTSEGRILSPLEVVALATRWKLPLNQAWYVPAGEAATVEAVLCEARWTLLDSGVQPLIAALAPSAREHGFLRHGDVQGEVLEGFVLTALSLLDPTTPSPSPSANENEEDNADDPSAPTTPPSRPRTRSAPDRMGLALAELLDGYERAMGCGARARATAAALELGAHCISREPGLLAELEAPIRGCPEPERVAVRADASELWRLLTPERRAGVLGCTPLGRLLGTLRSVYSHQVTLKAHRYCGVTLVQVQVNSDEVFAAHAATHARAGGGDSPQHLFRGLVIALGDKDTARSAVDALAAPSIGCTLLGLSKLKCLAYIRRTFGVLNLLPVLQLGGPAAYAQRIERFCANWGVPEHLVPAERDALALGEARLVHAAKGARASGARLVLGGA
jgi:hypothetical protein